MKTYIYIYKVYNFRRVRVSHTKNQTKFTKPITDSGNARRKTTKREEERINRLVVLAQLRCLIIVALLFINSTDKEERKKERLILTLKFKFWILLNLF